MTDSFMCFKNLFISLGEHPWPIYLQLKSLWYTLGLFLSKDKSNYFPIYKNNFLYWLHLFPDIGYEDTDYIFKEI